LTHCLLIIDNNGVDLLTSMHIFTHVVEANGFTAASTRLGLSRAAVSKHIAQLETHLGGQLLQRTTRRVSLTDVGQSYYERCKQILEDVADAECLVTGLNTEPRGSLRLNVPMSFGIKQIAPLLNRITTHYPQLSIDLSLSDRLVDVVEEGYDLVIRIATLKESNLIARRLALCRHIICAAPGYLDQHGRPVTAEDLAHHSCLRYAYTKNSNEWRVFKNRVEHRVRIKGPLLVNNGEALCVAAEHGAGITLLPTFIAGESIRKGKLEVVLPDYDCQQLGIYAVYSSRRHQSAKVRALIDFLASEISDPPCWDEGLFTH
jgi:DNA-binding transcriptional LysR family regulator